jgi:lysozyme
VTTDARSDLRRQLIRHEGLKLKPYRDSVGLLTIGVGRNLEHVGISHEEAMLLLDHDIDRSVLACVEAFGWFAGLDEIRQRAVVDLVFNMGIGGFQRFVNTIKLIEAKDYDAAADNLMMSRWFSQVGTRGPRIVAMMRTGEPPSDV